MVVGCENHGSALIVDVAQQRKKLRSKIGIEITSGLIGQNQAGLIDQRPRDGDALLLATGERLRKRRLAVVETEALEHLVCPPVGFTLPDSMKPKDKSDVLQDRLSPQQLEVLEDDPDLPPKLGQLGTSEGIDSTSSHPDFTFGGSLRSVEQSQKSGLAGTGWTGEKNHLPIVHREIDSAENLPPIIVLGDAADPDHTKGSLENPDPSQPRRPKDTKDFTKRSLLSPALVVGASGGA